MLRGLLLLAAGTLACGWLSTGASAVTWTNDPRTSASTVLTGSECGFNASTGRVYCFGGMDPATAQASNAMVRYDPTTGWSSIPTGGISQVCGRERFSSAVIGDTFWFYGGRGVPSGPCPSSFPGMQNFNMATEQFSARISPFCPSSCLTNGIGTSMAATPNGDVLYMIGGSNVANFGPYSQALFAFNVSNTLTLWKQPSQGSIAPPAVGYATLVAQRDTPSLLYFGGYTNAQQNGGVAARQNNLYRYHTCENLWELVTTTSAPNKPGPRHYHWAFTLGDWLYIGMGSVGASGTLENDVWRIFPVSSPATSVWEQVDQNCTGGDIPPARWMQGSAVGVQNNTVRLFVHGGLIGTSGTQGIYDASMWVMDTQVETAWLGNPYAPIPSLVDSVQPTCGPQANITGPPVWPEPCNSPPSSTSTASTGALTTTGALSTSGTGALSTSGTGASATTGALTSGTGSSPSSGDPTAGSVVSAGPKTEVLIMFVALASLFSSFAH